MKRDARSSDRNEIRRVVRALMSAWNERDCEAFVGCFTKTADYISGRGFLTRGRKGIAGIVSDPDSVFHARADGPMRIAMHRDTARVLFRWLTDGEPGGGVTTAWLVRRNGRWLIDAVQSSYPN